MKVNLYQLFLLFFVLTVNPLIGGNLNLVSTTLLFTLMVSAILLGGLITNYFDILDKDSLANYAFNFLIGVTVLFITVPFLNMIDASISVYFNIGLFVILLFALILKGKAVTLEFSFRKRESIEVVVLMLLFFYVGGVSEYTSSLTIGNKDATYFTTVVASLKNSPTLLTLNEFGSHINYQLFSFFPPTVISKYTLLSSHISLWNISMPFFVIMFGLILTNLFSTILTKSKQSYFLSYFGVILFIGLLPIHLKNLVSLNWGWYLPGMGSLLPGGNPPFTVALSVTLIILIIIRKHFLKPYVDWRYFLLVAFLTGLILPLKVAAFPGISSFVVMYYFFISRNIGKSILLSIIILIVGYLGFKISLPISGFTQVVFEPGFLLEYFGKSTNMLKNILITGTFLFAFLLIKLVIFFYYFFKATRTTVIDSMVIASIISLIITLLFPSLLKILVVDNNFNVIQDLTFDSLQFSRYGFFVVTIISGMVFLEICGQKQHKVFKGLILIYSSLVIIGWITFSLNGKETERKEYYDIVENELNSFGQPELYATFANNEYIPQVFVADDYKNFYVTSNRNVGGYAMTSEHMYRWDLMKNLEVALTRDRTHDVELFISQLKNENVTAIIFNPDQLEFLNKNNLMFFEDTGNMYVKKIKNAIN